MRRSYLFVFTTTLLLGAPTAFTQDLDSLRRVWADVTRPDSARFLAYNDLIWEGFLFNDPDSAHVMARIMEQEAMARRLPRFVASAIDAQAASWYARGRFPQALATFERSRRIHEEIGDLAGLADVITNIATMHSFMGEKDKALDLYGEGLAMHEEQGDSVGIANDLNSIGTIYMMRGDHLRAVDLFARSLSIQQALGNVRGMATTIINIGTIYMSQGEYARALEQYVRAERMANTLMDEHLRAKALMEIGTCHQELGDQGRAMDHYQRSLELCTGLEDEHGISATLNKIGELHRIRGDNKLAMASFERSAAIAREQDAPFSEGAAWVGLGNALFAEGRSTEALQAARNALPLAQDAGELSLHRDAVDLTYRALKELGRDREAMAMLELGMALNDSLMREENHRAILRHEFAYAYEQQVMADSVRHQVEKLEMITTHRARRNIMGGALVILILVGVTQWARMRYMKRANGRIMAAQHQVMALERLREAETVRTRIARDIHDEMGGAVTRIGMLSTEAKRTLGQDATATASTLERIAEVSRELAISLQDVVSTVDPRSDDAASVVAHARVVTTRILEGAPLDVQLHFAHEGGALVLDPERRRSLLLLLKEAITNVLKHAEAQTLKVSLTSDDTGFSLIVEDDGRGFDASVAYVGNGLRNMRERAEELGAGIHTVAANGSGCRVHIHGPWT